MKVLSNIFRRLRRPRREAIANSLREAAIANAMTPEEPMEFGEWFKVSPYGQFPGLTPQRPQYFTREDAENVTRYFESVRGRLASLFRGVPIYRGHPDVDPQIWPDDRRLGKLVDLEVRDDGLWGRAEWNSLGRENQEEGYWMYPSPRWDAPAGRPKFHPDRLLSIGLTNTPRIAESEPVANANLPASSADEPETEDTNLMDPKLLRETLGLPPEATDDECLAKMQALMTAAADAEAKVIEMENAKQMAETTAADATREKDEMANSLATARAQANNAILDLAIAEGRIPQAERSAWAARLDGDEREAAANSLAALTPPLNTRPLGGGATRTDLQQQDNLREAVANAVAAKQATGMTYHDAWSAVKKDPKFSAFFQKKA